MAHVRTKDPFGFVGAHVVFSGPQQAVAAAGLGGVSGGGGAALFGDAPPVHTWVTRYDARLDCYTLFAPGRRGALAISRGDMMKLVADPSFEVRRGDDPKFASDGDEWPPPVEDTTSRYVGVPVVKAGDAAVKGSVACFLPFADVYRAEFEDGSSDEMSEDAIIEGMIRILTTTGRTGAATPGATAASAAGATGSREDSTRKRKRTPPAAAASPVSLLPPTTVRSVSAPVVSVAVPPPSMMPVSYAAVLGMDSSPVVTHSNILELAAARNRSSGAGAGGFGGTGFTPVAQADRPAAVAPTPRQPVVPPPSFVKSEPTASSSSSSSNGATNIIMLIDDEPDVELIPLDEEVQVPVVTATSGNDPWATSASTQPQPFYLISKGEHQQVAPLETRNLAYKYVREELLNLLDTQEAGAKKVAMQYDILRNPDIKHISSIKRFTEASGLVVLNHLLATYLAEHEQGTRDADVLLLLKVVAMLPIPARKHIADSKIALTIGKLAKPRSLEMYPKLPVCVTHLAKWIKRKWTEHFSKLENQEKDVNRLRGTPSASKSGHPSHRLATRTPPPQSSGNGGSQRGSANADRLVDTTPIPRLASRPVLSNPTDASSARPTADVMGNPIAARASVSLPLSAGGASSGRKSSLKPDWMRQQETLRRTRFTSEGGQDSAAEFNHYKRVRESSAGGAQSNSASRQVSGANAGASYTAPDNEQLESAGGMRGAYGRKQKLSFGSRWNVVEFLRDAPPNSIRPASGGSRSSSYHQQSQRQQGRPRSILRRESRYQGSLDSFR